jgi:adenosylcobinamide-GDP ribazoletransferase
MQAWPIALTSVARAAAGALAFLTVMPIPGIRLDDRDVARGAVFFPLVGALIGAGVASIGIGLDDLLTPFLAAVVAVSFEAVVTGALHLDGLADTADGLGARERDRALEIMREGTIGAFGAAALALALLLEAAAIALLLADDGAVLTLTAAFAFGRAAPLALAWALPYARADEGSGRILTERSPRALLAAGIAIACGLAAALVGLDAVALVGGAMAGTVIVAAAAAWRLGGVTGDVLGATIQLATVGSLLAAVAVS